MKARPIGMLWTMPMEWRNPLPGVFWRARKALPEDRLVARMNRLTLLGHAMRDLGNAAEERCIGAVIDSDRSMGYITLVANAATCLASAKAPRKPESEPDRIERLASEAAESGRVGQKWVSRHLVAPCQ